MGLQLSEAVEVEQVALHQVQQSQQVAQAAVVEVELAPTIIHKQVQLILVEEAVAEEA